MLESLFGGAGEVGHGVSVVIGVRHVRVGFRWLGVLGRLAGAVGEAVDFGTLTLRVHLVAWGRVVQGELLLKLEAVVMMMGFRVLGLVLLRLRELLVVLVTFEARVDVVHLRLRTQVVARVMRTDLRT
jgi:hypothetical protein